MLACFAPAVFLLGLALALFSLVVHFLAFGLCWRCGVNRKPRCGCAGGDPSDPDVRRIRWRDPREKK